MARSFGKDVKNNFVRGVVTEFSGLNFPEDAATDASNVIFSKKDGVSRRPGIEFEDGFVGIHSWRGYTHTVVKEYIWENVGSFGDLSFLVLQVGSILYFYQITEQSALSANRKPFTYDLNNIAIAPYLGNFPCEFSQGRGDLFIANPRMFPARLKYTGAANGVGTITVQPIFLQIRDLEGAPDPYGVAERPAGFDAGHVYNLFNQGWYSRVKAEGISGRMTAFDAWRKTRKDDYPSNADIWWLNKNEKGHFDPDYIDKKVTSTEAPKGHYILQAFSQDRSNVGAPIRAGSFPAVTPGVEYPSCIAFFGNRIWYSGVQWTGFQDKVYYSQTIISDDDHAKCYSKGDPTDEKFPGLLPTDGGVISISEVGKIIKLVPLQNFMLVFASNGIWSITGGETSDFRATDYSVQKISDIQTLSASSFVLPTTGYPVWWNADGIFSLRTKDKETQRQTLEVYSLTDETVRTLFTDIPAVAKKFAKGAYNPLENTIQWVYWTRIPTTAQRNYHYDHVLTHDLTTGAFYTWELPKPPVTNTPAEDRTYPLVAGIIVTRGTGVDFEDSQITDSNDSGITDNSGDSVTVLEARTVPLSSSYRYTTVIDVAPSLPLDFYFITFSQFRRDDYLDWKIHTATGIDYDSYFDAGWVIRGDAQRPFQNNIVYVYSKAVENSSCFLQGVWDYSADDSSGRETSKHQCYIDRSFYGTQRRKIRVRGRGHVLQLKFTSESGKPFNILGWSSFQSANNLP